MLRGSSLPAGSWGAGPWCCTRVSTRKVLMLFVGHPLLVGATVLTLHGLTVVQCHAFPVC